MSCPIYQNRWFWAFTTGMKWDLVLNFQWIFFKTKQAQLNPLPKQKGTWIPFSLCLSKPGGTGEGGSHRCVPVGAQEHVGQQECAVLI